MGGMDEVDYSENSTSLLKINKGDEGPYRIRGISRFLVAIGNLRCSGGAVPLK